MRGQRAGLILMLVATGIAAVLVAATGLVRPSAAASPRAAEPALADVPLVDDWRQITLPMDAYRTGIQDANTIGRAVHQLVGTCLSRFGFVWDVPFNEVSVPGPQITHYRLYGLLDEVHALAYGYHPGPTVPGGKATESRAIDSREYANVLGAKFGGGSYLGQPIPEGGCYAEARRAVADGGPAFNPGLPEELVRDAWISARSDSRVLAGFARWSACMTESGYSYRTPMDANNDSRWSGDTATPAEISVAVADVACKKRTNLTGIRMAVDAAYQQRLIAQHADALAAVAAGRERQLRNAARILAGG